MSGRAEMMQLVRKLRKQGFSVDRTGSGHWKVVHPETGDSTVLSFSPKNANLKALHRELGAMGYER